MGDEELGLVFMRGRVYDPKLGRFLTADPFIGNALSGQSWHRYAYVENNPLKYTDPSGFTPEEARQTVVSRGYEDGNVLTTTVRIDYGDADDDDEEPAELGALRTLVDVGSSGDTTAFYPNAPPSGSERDRADDHNVMLEVLGGAAGAYANDVIDTAKGTVLFAVFPQAYFAWQGYNFWSGIGGGASEGYKQDGVFGALAGAINAVNPFAHVGISLAATVDAAEKGDYAKAGEQGYQAAKAIAGIVAVAVGIGVDRQAAGNARPNLPRYDGPKPTYRVNPAHVPGRGMRASNLKTPLPRDAEHVFQRAVPNDPTSPTAWFGKSAEGQIYRYSLGNDGSVHFSGIRGVGDGTRNFTPYAAQRLGVE
jgi:RHS repeat-associated protein